MAAPQRQLKRYILGGGLYGDFQPGLKFQLGIPS